MAKGGKGRKGGGGGGGKTRKYSRDNKGRFASTGSGGATARGGRLKTASGNKRKTQTITATGQKGVLAKPKGLKPGAIKPKAAAAAAKPAALSTKAKTPKFTTEQSGRVRRAALGGGRTAIVRKNSAVIINAKGEPIMTRKGLPNITAGKKYAANPNARGPRLMGRDRSEASPSRGYIRTSKPTGTINKPKGLKPGSIGLKPAAAKPAAPKPASTAAERIKIKTPIRRAMSTNRASVVTPGQRSRLETGKGAKTKGARLNSSVAKPRTAGNTKPQVASRVKRKLAAENVKMNKIVGAERVGARQGKQYERSLKRQTTLQRAKTFLESGKLPGKDNSIAAQRNTKQARQRLAAKNAERRTAAAKPAAAAKPSAKVDTSMKGITVRRARALAPRTSTYLSQKLNIQSAITKSAANAIYNRQRTVGKALGLNEAVVRNPIGIMPKISGSIRSRAAQLREAARKRVVGGRRR